MSDGITDSLYGNVKLGRMKIVGVDETTGEHQFALTEQGCAEVRQMMVEAGIDPDNPPSSLSEFMAKMGFGA